MRSWRLGSGSLALRGALLGGLPGRPRWSWCSPASFVPAGGFRPGLRRGLCWQPPSCRGACRRCPSVRAASPLASRMRGIEILPWPVNLKATLASHSPVPLRVPSIARHKENPQMPEAVIVDTIRTPIGRAFKGSLAQLRPMSRAPSYRRLLERNPEVQPSEVEDVFCGSACRRVCRRSTSRESCSCSPRAARDRQRRDDVGLLRFQPRLDQACRQRGARRPGRHLYRRRCRMGEPIQRADRARRGRGPNERLQGKDGTPNAYIEMGITAVTSRSATR